MRSRNVPTLLIYGLPTALAALILPAVLLLSSSLGGRPAPAQARVTEAQAASAPAQPTEVHLTVNEWSFTPKQVQLPLGQPVSIVLDNTGKLEHDVSIPALGVLLKAGA